MTETDDRPVSFPLDKDAVATEIRSQVAKELGLDMAQIADDTVLKELPGADSVRLLRIVAQVERLYDVEFEDEDIFRIRTVSELVTLVLDQAADEQ